MTIAKRILNIGLPRAAALGFLFLWLLPAAYVGLFNRSIPGIPGYLNNQYSISALFTTRAQFWSEFYFLVSPDGEHWTPVVESDYSSMQPFGRRTRIKRMLEAPMSEDVMTNRYTEIMHFVAAAYGRVHPDSGLVNFVRLEQAIYPTGVELSNCEGAWAREIYPPINGHIKPLALYKVKTGDFYWE